MWGFFDSIKYIFSGLSSFRLFGTVEIDYMLTILTAIFNAEMFNLALVLNNPPPLQYGETYLNSILMIFNKDCLH